MDNDEEENSPGQAANDYNWSMDEDEKNNKDDKSSKSSGTGSMPKIKPSSGAKMPGGATAGSAGTGGAAAGGTAAGGAAAGGTAAGGAAAGGTAAGGAAAGGAAAGGAAAGGAAAGGAATAAGGAAAVGGIAGLLAAAWPIILVVLIILIIISIIGIFGFIIYMPDLVRDKLRQFAIGIWDKLQGYVIGYDEAIVNDDKLVEISQYLQDMGYDLVGYGFASKVEYEDDDASKIKSVKSSYLKSYLAAENRTYLISNDTFNFKDMLQSIGTPNKWGDSPSSAWGSGMIHIDEGIWELLELQSPGVGLTKDIVETLINDISIDRESNSLKIRRLDLEWDFWNSHYDTTYYNLDGWSGRYGKPFELLLTLHLATMAPDLVNEFACNPNLDTKVNISSKNIDFSTNELVATINGEEKTIRSEYDIEDLENDTDSEGNPIYSADTIKFLKKLWGKADEIKTRDVYITSVEHHWFRDVYFDTEGEKVDVIVTEEVDDAQENNDEENESEEKPKESKTVYDENGNVVTEQRDINVYDSSGSSTQEDELEYVGEDMPDEISSIIIRGDRQSGFKQVKDGVRGATNPTTKELFNQEYFIYDGSVATAEAIEKGTAKKQKISMDKNSLTAFSMLEQVETADAQLVYRDLKELVVELGYFDEDDFDEIDRKCLEWLIPDYEPIEWPYTKWEKQFTEYGTLIRSKSSVEELKKADEEDLEDDTQTADSGENTEDTDEKEKSDKNNLNNSSNSSSSMVPEGFEAGLEVVAPAKCVVQEVLQQDTNEYASVLQEGITIEGGGLKLKITSKNKAEGYTLIIFGIDVNSNITEGKELETSDVIGTTTDGDICIILIDKNRAVISNVEEYIKVPEVQKYGTIGGGINTVSSPEKYGVTEDLLVTYCAVIAGEAGNNYEDCLWTMSAILNRWDTGKFSNRFANFDRFLYSFSEVYHNQSLLNQRLPGGKWPYSGECEKAVVDALNGVRPHKYTNFCAANSSLETNWKNNNPNGKSEVHNGNFFCDWVEDLF